MPVKVDSSGPVKIIKQVCPKCFYRLSYTPVDVIYTTDGDGDSYRHIKCPRKECEATISLPRDFEQRAETN